MEERIIDEEIGRKIKVKKLQDGTTDVVDGLAEPETENTEDAEVSEEEFTFEIPDFEEDDEDMVGLSPEEALALRQRKAEEMAARKAEYESLVVSGGELLSAGDFAAAEEVYAHASFRVPTGELNDLIGDAVRLQEPPSYQGRRMRVFFSSQVSVCPPVFVLHVNDEGLLHFSYQRYLENPIRRAYDFTGTPIKVVVREKKEED